MLEPIVTSTNVFMTLNNYLTSKIVADYFSVDKLTNYLSSIIVIQAVLKHGCLANWFEPQAQFYCSLSHSSC